jgi:hypothetical protein
MGSPPRPPASSPPPRPHRCRTPCRGCTRPPCGGRPSSDTGGEFYPLLTRPVAAPRIASSGSGPGRGIEDLRPAPQGRPVRCRPCGAGDPERRPRPGAHAPRLYDDAPPGLRSIHPAQGFEDTTNPPAGRQPSPRRSWRTPRPAAGARTNAGNRAAPRLRRRSRRDRSRAATRPSPWRGRSRRTAAP